MTLIIAGTIDIDPDKWTTARPAAIEMMTATRNEAGCYAYVFSEDIEVEGRFNIYEKWESQHALDAHFASPHMATFRAALADFGAKPANVLKYEIASEGPLR